MKTELYTQALQAIYKKFEELLKQFPYNGTHSENFTSDVLTITESFISDIEDSQRPGFEFPSEPTETGCEYERVFFSSAGLHKDGQIVLSILNPDINTGSYLTLDKDGKLLLEIYDYEDFTEDISELGFDIPVEEFENTLDYLRKRYCKQGTAE